MAETERDFFVTGLRNAHAMEVQARELMERQIDRTQDYPELRTRLQQHFQPSRWGSSSHEPFGWTTS